jgi:chromosome partitioning protein
VFGRKKRRQEPIPAVPPETRAQPAWHQPPGRDGETAGADASVDSGGTAVDVSRETRGGGGAAVDDITGERADELGGRGLTVTQTVVREATAVGADEQSGSEPAMGALSEAGAVTGLGSPEAVGWRPSADGLDRGASGAWRTDSEASVGEDLGGSTSSFGGGVGVARHSAGDAASSSAVFEAGSAAVDASAEGLESAGADDDPRKPVDLGVQLPDGVDAMHGAFSSAPRPQASRPAAPAGAGVSRETVHEAATQPFVNGADLGGGVEAPGIASAQPERAGENEEVSSQPQQVVGAVHDDEARRAALVDSLPDADEDTPLMAQIQADARRRIQLRGRRFPRPAQTRIITVANQKGGVGKTTTTVNLAAALAQSGLNVLVLDNDPQGNASTALGVEHHAGTPSIYEVLIDEAPMAGAVQECPDVPNLWCVPATIDLSGAEIELVSMVARETRLRIALDAYLTGRVAAGEEPIDYVFVDCPPSLGLLTINAFVVGREVLIPIQCEYYALEGLTQLLKTIQLIQAHLNPELHVSTILLTMYDARTNLAQQVAQEVRDHFPETTLRTSVPRSVRISEAPSYGQTVITYDAGSSGALAYLEAARELAERGAEGGNVGGEAPGAAADGALTAAAGDGMNHTNENGTPGGTSSVVGSSAGTHQEEQ